jgi:alkaline phosphatase
MFNTFKFPYKTKGKILFHPYLRQTRRAFICFLLNLVGFLPCRRKTFNGGLSVVPETQDKIGDCSSSSGGSQNCPGSGTTKEECCPVRRIAHLMEGCKAKGMSTGIVVTTILPHATPAAWSSHSSSRKYYDFIAQQQIEADPPFDVLFGGGRRYYDSRRKDKRDIMAEHADTYTFVNDAAAMREEIKKSAASQKPLVGLFADGSMAYEVDRLAQMEERRQPSIEEVISQSH